LDFWCFSLRRKKELGKKFTAEFFQVISKQNCFENMKSGKIQRPLPGVTETPTDSMVTS
jgi:hypothetical protein